ncbi:hypothetical protein NUW58_g8366 [Xylaria curta]|uniref:Uncharacterized protein n=1 Tax=Xylaria curta TaxID=42375 RepID=A0ACC1N9V5_9PEZI|nr:hypothetical protein NUW58_g8366 [Xylaria curta]
MDVIMTGHYAYPYISVAEASIAPVLIHAIDSGHIGETDNVIPQAMAEDRLLYCIWYPEFAEEDTYHTLARQYPRTRYAELIIETGNLRFLALLNGDTYCKCAGAWNIALVLPGPGSATSMYRGRRASHDGHIPYMSGRVYLNYDEVRLLYEPLRPDLSTVKKRLLIETAAFEGNVDRYARLAISAKDNEQVRTNVRDPRYLSPYYMRTLIKTTISARRITMNDPQEFYDAGWPPDVLQLYLIWWPLRPDRSMLEILAEKVSGMKEQVAVAAIFCDYEDVYKTLRPPLTGIFGLP